MRGIVFRNHQYIVIGKSKTQKYLAVKIKINRLNEDFHMEATNDEGARLEMDGSNDIGGQNLGMKPMQLLLAAVGGCSTIDVLVILKKQKQKVRSFSVEVEADKEKVGDYSLYKNVCLHFIIEGELDPAKAKKAIELSLDKYCSVAKTLEPTTTVTYTLTVNGSKKD
jgi:putative redox protein